MPLVTVTVAIDRSGLVKEATVEGDYSAEVISPIEASIREWLFLPKLQDGQPIECVVQFPVEVSVE